MPSSLKSGKRILDLGCGTGAWCREIALENPQSEVLGLDIAPPDPKTSPLSFPGNCSFRVANIEQSWGFQEDDPAFDFINGRMLVLAIKDWDALFAEVYRNLKPGGYFQILDVILGVDPVEPDPHSPLARWIKYSQRATSLMGVDYESPYQHEERIKKCGFKIVESSRLQLFADAGKWVDNASEDTRRAGRMWQETSCGFVDIMSNKIFVGSDLSAEEGQKLSADAKEDFMQNGTSKGYHGT